MALPLEMPEDGLQTDWPATRAEGLRRLEAFAPRMGGHYKGQRNRDSGPGRRDNVSLLSPYIARRIVTEEEAVSAALARHKPGTCEKFVQEVVWRTYFKGWLEIRPQVWADYREGLAEDRRVLEGNRGLARDVLKAEAGETGIEAFDVWARELVATGYLHNHARMWFASIWCFTLDLPWRLGADFFLRHLLDGDAASNTLGWRWVAGLHTQGKNYAATASNIRKFTADRDGGPLGAEGLARGPDPLDEGPLPARREIRAVAPPRFEEPTALLLTTEDLHPDSAALRGRPAAVATLHLTGARSDAPVSEAVSAFDRAALADAAARLDTPDAPAFDGAVRPHEIVDWLRAAGCRRVATGFLHRGWVHDWFEAARPVFGEAGIAVEEWRRPWDDGFHPHATAGFFKVKKEIPSTLRALGYAV
ncbi:MAG: FAD-binding domain-containing protein [Pseudomonadota bacterium]